MRGVSHMKSEGAERGPDNSGPSALGKDSGLYLSVMKKGFSMTNK